MSIGLFLTQEEPKRVLKLLSDPACVDQCKEELLQFKLQNVWVLVDLPKGHRAIGTKWVYRNKKDERGIVVRNKAKLVCHKDYTKEMNIILGSTKTELVMSLKAYKNKFSDDSMENSPSFWDCSPTKKKGFLSVKIIVYEILRKEDSEHFNHRIGRRNADIYERKRIERWSAVVGGEVYLTKYKYCLLIGDPNLCRAVLVMGRTRETGVCSKERGFINHRIHHSKSTFAMHAQKPKWCVALSNNFEVAEASTTALESYQDGVTSIPTTEIFEHFGLMCDQTDSDKFNLQKCLFTSMEGRKLFDEEVQEKASTDTELLIQEVTPTEVIQDQEAVDSKDFSTARELVLLCKGMQRKVQDKIRVKPEMFEEDPKDSKKTYTRKIQ
ncbi:putative ribonuclease H-like domain-containing protein [Tanacetum coccineum]